MVPVLVVPVLAFVPVLAMFVPALEMSSRQRAPSEWCPPPLIWGDPEAEAIESISDPTVCISCSTVLLRAELAVAPVLAVVPAFATDAVGSDVPVLLAPVLLAPVLLVLLPDD